MMLTMVLTAVIAQATPLDLRCEYLTDPLAIDSPAPRLSWLPADSGLRADAQSAFQVLVATDSELLEPGKADLWDSGRVESDRAAQIVYAGKPLKALQHVTWTVRTWNRQGTPSDWGPPAHWSMGPLAPPDWGGATWIGDPKPAPPTTAAVIENGKVVKPPTGYDPLPATMLRTQFRLKAGAHGAAAPIERATVYATALGVYELRINGHRVGDAVLAPEWTDYHKRIQYQAFDVTEMIKPGENAIGATLGDGWYAGRIGLHWLVPGGPPRAIYGRRTALLLRLEIERADGSRQTVVSDGSWRATTDGPIRVADILDGVEYDARREMPNWDAPGYDDSGWGPAEVRDPPAGALVAQPNEPIRVTRELPPVAIAEPKPGAYVVDFGQNMAGACRLRLSAPPGTSVTLRHAEVLNPDGTIYTTNLRGATQTDRYTCRGGGEELFEPPFTYHGFRYVEITGLPTRPEPDQIIARVIHSAPPEAGSFECSDPMLNRLMANIVWTQRANMQSTPTDCPQRDERLGWMGDILAFAPTACFTMDMGAFFTKWVPDVRDAQAADGRFPDFAPHPFGAEERFTGAPAWGDAGVFVPWQAYLAYGDTRILDGHYDAAKRWIEFIHAKNPDLIWRNNRGNDYGDWLNADTIRAEGVPPSGAEMPKEAFATAFFARSTELVSRMAAVTGRADDAAKYARLAADIRAAFNRAYVQPDGLIAGDTQAGYAIALDFDLLPEAARPAAARRMVAASARYGGHLSTGFHSTVALMRQLTAHAATGEAYSLITKRTIPSWGYEVDNGATTIWERWDGFVAGRGFQDPGMNSFSHYALGAVGEWMYRTIGGITPDESSPGWAHCFIRPEPGGGLTWAKASYDSIRGLYACEWRIDQGTITVNVIVPVNGSATVRVPTPSPGTLAEGGRPAATAAGVAVLAPEPGAAVVRVGSGMYAFSAPAPLQQ